MKWSQCSRRKRRKKRSRETTWSFFLELFDDPLTRKSRVYESTQWHTRAVILCPPPPNFEILPLHCWWYRTSTILAILPQNCRGRVKSCWKGKQECTGYLGIRYVDSNYAGDLDKRRSITGYVFTLSRALVSWRSTLQSTVSLSSMEAKYMAMTEAMKKTI